MNKPMASVYLNTIYSNNAKKQKSFRLLWVEAR